MSSTNIRLYALSCGWLTMPMRMLLAGGTGDLKIPVPVYLIEHPRGRLLFDTGLHTDMLTDAPKRLGPLDQYFTVDFSPGEDLAARLAALQLSVNDIDWIVNSHLHFDHCGGNAAIPNSPVLVQAKELEAANNADLAAGNGLAAQDWDCGHDFVLAHGEHDIFGDGSVVCIPTHGHTPGHQSLRVRLASGDVVLAGDACYLRQTLEDMHLPSIVFDAEQMRASLRILADLQSRGARIFYGHDPDFWQSLPQAPAAVT